MAYRMASPYIGGMAPIGAPTVNVAQPGPRPGSAISRPAIGSGIAPEAESALQRAMAYYQEGGGFGAGTEAALGRARTKTMAAGMQSLVSAGLAGTTMAAGLGKKFEEEVGMPTRAGVEETRAQALSGLETLKAQIIQGATESARSRALQEYLARLQSGGSSRLVDWGGSAGGAGRGGDIGDMGGGFGDGYETPRAPSLIGAGGVGGGAGVTTQLLEPATPDMYTILGDGAGSEQEFQSWLAPRLKREETPEYVKKAAPEQYSAGYATWRKWKGYVD